jgi:hypothetical protein
VGLLSALHRPAAADPDPHPGIGGYRTPRGPAGQTGYPGSTAATRQNPQAAADELADAPVFRRRGGGRAVVRRRAATITAQQADVIPAPARDGSLPYQGAAAKTNPDRVRDTEKRPRIITSQGTPGGERQRNTVYYGGRQAIPGQEHTYRSAPKGGRGTTEVSVTSRYVYNGVNGGTDALDDMMTARRMPYTGHGPGSGQPGPARGSLRGAVLDGDRFYTAPDGMTEGDQGGAFGKARRSQRHRPTIFSEPAPMNGEFYDTTSDAGGPRVAGRNRQVVSQVHVSPRAARRGWRRRG